jgi:hypothetical protein
MKLLKRTWKIAFIVLVSGSGILFADCPEGSRPTTDIEQQHYVANLQALKAILPSAPDGWALQPAQIIPGAPTSVCKGSKPVAAIDATYVSLMGRKENEERNRDYEARIDALRTLSPEDQRQADTLYHQGSDLGYKSIAELKNKNQAESDRLRAEANKAYAASKAIRQAHLEKVSSLIRALEDERQAANVSPDVRVHVVVHDLALDQKTVMTESVQIEGVAKAYYSPEKTLTISLGSSLDGKPVWVQIQGDRKQAEVVGRLFGRAANAGTVANR